MALTVVMPTYHRVDLLKRVVPAYLDQDPAELIVVLDGPQPEPAAWLAGVRDPRLRVVALAENAGPSRARAHGVEAARTRLVLITDDDIVPGPGMLDRHRTFHAGRSRAVLAGYVPIAIPSRRRPGQVSSRIFATDYERAMDRWERRPETVLDGLWGGNVSMERSLYLSAEAIRAADRLRYFEDMDLGLRLRELGASGHFDRSAAGLHLHDKSNTSFLREATARGAAVRMMEDRWHLLPDTTHADDEPAVVARLRRAVGLAERVGGLVPAVVWVLRQTLTATGRLHFWPAEEMTARLLRGVLETTAYVRAGRNA